MIAVNPIGLARRDRVDTMRYADTPTATKKICVALPLHISSSNRPRWRQHAMAAVDALFRHYASRPRPS